MLKRLKNLLPIVLLSLIPTFVLWLPFLLRLPSFWTIPLPRNGLASIVANYDGPLYIVVAKTFYNVQAIKDTFSFPLPVEYYAAHFPLYPLLIRLVATVTNYPYAMLGITLLSSVFALYFFSLLISKYTDGKNVIWMTAVFALLPARWLTVRSIGSPEPLFMAATIASIYFFTTKKYLWAGIAGALAMLTKSPGILLFAAYAGYLIIPELKNLGVKSFAKWAKGLNWRAWPVVFIPLSLLGLFVIYKFTFNDLLAYFHSGDNIHLFFPPFQIFNYSAPWVGTFWLEEVIYIYLFAALGLIKLIKEKYEVLAWYVGVFLFSIVFVSHRDLARYALPILPFILVAFWQTLARKEFKFVLAFLLIPVFLASIAFISQNVMPISDWTPLL
ncbi:hypothetical protein A2975_05220 [Candidatus Woesebacteria bacterium RIFCSPLOWO2_01_FULL_44_14]|uniref:Glycosyltransferase RgtA/B/C/D-like domain-containing protein n=1 Tax=Candidatus Woesebacteria bacterium RIFCSPLOWO2_01_FULL_44_14 TaxID=1802525 RepID=A0A1F8C2W5_9BACT|nr:MAG: hypothetical protein A2975_05220 [Candidatus Woesebacteria bacterium RIFCSPLOWO2_01_FULL_44_14]